MKWIVWEISMNVKGAIVISPDGHTAYVNTFSQTGTNDIYDSRPEYVRVRDCCALIKRQ